MGSAACPKNATADKGRRHANLHDTPSCDDALDKLKQM